MCRPEWRSAGAPKPLADRGVQLRPARPITRLRRLRALFMSASSASPSASWPLTAANALLQALGKGRGSHFDAETVLESLRCSPGEMFGAAPVEDAVRVLMDGLQRTPFHPVGQMLTARTIQASVAHRLHVATMVHERPELLDTALIPPIIVFGLPRSGTTFLHRLLALDPAHRAIPFWQLVRLPPPDQSPAAAAWQRRNIAKSIWVRRQAVRGMDRTHFLRADTPEECTWMLSLTFESLALNIAAPIPEYAEWYSKRDRHRAYAEYKVLLQILQAARPEARLVMKAPEHVDAVAAILKSVPNALLVQTHRDPADTIASGTSMFAALHRGVVPLVDTPCLARTILHLSDRALERNRADREAHPDAVADVRYADLIADPVGAVRTVYRLFGLNMSDAYLERIEAYVTAHPQHKHGIHRYQLEDYGLSRDAISERFTTYREAFDLN